MKVPLTDPTAMLRRIPTQAVSPALLELLEHISSPILLTDDAPAGELTEMPAEAALMDVA